MPRAFQPMVTTRATAVGGRNGVAGLDDGSLTLDTAMPGTGRPGVNPEQLFAMGYAACFDNALLMLARRQQLKLRGTKTSAEVALGQFDHGGYALEIDLHVQLSGLSPAQAQALVNEAHAICPYSCAVRGNVDVRLHVAVS